jgi:hypothetical protein
MSHLPYNVTEEWDALLQAVRETESDLKGVVPFREALADARERAHAANSLRETLKTTSADAGQRLREVLTVGEDAAVALRNFIRGALGMSNEKLRRYGIQPRGKYRGPKRKLGRSSPSAVRKRACGRSK